MYAGPVGWISGKKSEFAVAIRSSLVSRNEKDNVSLHSELPHVYTL
jgi:isochorismate synthase EntC